MKKQRKEKTRVLLLENIHPAAVKVFEDEGCEVESLKAALGEKELAAKIRDVHLLGIRSKTRVTPTVLKNAENLFSIGAYCIGTNQIDTLGSERLGIPVFNAPFSNTRSVAEMIIGEIIMLARQLGDRSRELHEGVWKKTAANCYEVRGRTLGIVGYGHIGSQVGVLAEMIGMTVYFYDIVPKLPLGNTKSCATLGELLSKCDFVTLHVPATPRTKNMISSTELGLMKKGSYLLNASRNTVVDLDAAAAALKSGHLAGGAFDVFPDEPDSNSDGFECAVRGLSNVVLTPHVGGSTEEAQYNIGKEVTSSLLKFLDLGTTTGAVNFPHLDVPLIPGTYRVLNVHRNVPGVLKDINRIVSDLNANIHAQFLSTSPEVGYLVMDLDQNVSEQVMNAIAALKTSIRTRQVTHAAMPSVPAIS